MQKFLFCVVIAITILLIASIFTPQGGWTFVAILSSGYGHIIVVIFLLLVMAFVTTFPSKKKIAKIRILLCSAILALMIFTIASSMDLGGTLYGEWELVRDANVDGFRIADSPNFGLYFAEDGSLLKIYPDYDRVEESSWRKSRYGNVVVIYGRGGYSYRFQRFGRRLILELAGSERPRIPHMTPPTALEVTFRRRG